MSSKSTNGYTNLNFASNTRASLELHAVPELTFNCTNFAIPSISTSTAKQPTPFTDFPLRGDTLVYSPLEITFIITENLENWRLAVEWMEGFTAPHDVSEWINRKFEYSDGTLFLYNSHNNLTVQIEFTNLTPTFLGGINFDTTPDGVVELVCSMTLEYQNFIVKSIIKK